MTFLFTQEQNQFRETAGDICVH